MVAVGIPWALHAEVVCDFRLPPHCPEDRAEWLRKVLPHMKHKHGLSLTKVGRNWLKRLQDDKAN